VVSNFLARPLEERLAHLHDYSHQLSGSCIFSNIDLARAYNQIPVNPADIQKTVITIPFGLFEFPFMSFGLRNAAETFQRFMDDILRGFDFCFAYLDAILVFSQSLEEHHLRTLFDRLETNRILINPTKCVFKASEVTFLGYKVSAEGSRRESNTQCIIREATSTTQIAAARTARSQPIIVDTAHLIA
jgi:hypothetical protein